MGPLTATLDILSLVGKAGDMDTDDVDEMRRALNGTKSITERAKKGLFIYPVIHSPGMCDTDIVLKINKFLEIQYGIFTLMTVGLNPSVQNGNISSYLDSVSAEDYTENNSFISNIELESVNGIESNMWYSEFLSNNKTFFDEYKFSTEAAGVPQATPRRGGNNPQATPTQSSNNSTQTTNNPRSDMESRFWGDHETDFNLEDSKNKVGVTLMNDYEGLTKKIKGANPTIITLKLYLKGIKDPVSVPIALKTNPHFITNEELCYLFDSAIEDKRAIMRFIKLSTGEINFFRDFLFNMDRIKRDQKLYAKFGAHPWYQQFLSRKETNLFKRFGIIFANITGKFKGLANSVPSSLPTASIILTVNELEQASKMKFGFLLKHEKIIWQVLNRLSLLSIGIYNPELEMCSFYFNGFKKPMIVALSEMKGDDEDATAEMAKLMNTMLKRGIM